MNSDGQSPELKTHYCFFREQNWSTRFYHLEISDKNPSEMPRLMHLQGDNAEGIKDVSFGKLKAVSVERSDNPLLLTNTHYFKKRFISFTGKQQLV